MNPKEEAEAILALNGTERQILDEFRRRLEARGILDAAGVALELLNIVRAGSGELFVQRGRVKCVTETSLRDPSDEYWEWVVYTNPDEENWD